MYFRISIRVSGPASIVATRVDCKPPIGIRHNGRGGVGEGAEVDHRSIITGAGRGSEF